MSQTQHNARYYTLGCKLNYAETSEIADRLAERGIHTLHDGDSLVPTDICIVNTCSVTAEANKKCRQLIRSLRRRYPEASIVVTGCYAQLCPADIAAIEGVEIVAGNDRKGALAGYVEQWLAGRERHEYITPAREIREFTPACSKGDRTRYFLKVQDGCDYYCTYCTIPMARGRSRSGSIADIVAQARRVAEEGGREIVITGVNTGDFGKGRDDNFFDLIRALDEVDGIERYRISSIEPNLLTDEMIAWVAQSRRFMPHFHIPLQAGADETLRLMRRRYDTGLFARRIEAIRSLVPDAFIGVDLIAGTRGETPELFEQSRQFVESLDISRLHVFPYSERPGTKALDIPYSVDQAEKHRRVGVMMEISDRKHKAFAERFIGASRPVLVEHPAADGSTSGFTDNYLRVRLAAPRPDLANTVTETRLTAITLTNDEPVITGIV